MKSCKETEVNNALLDVIDASFYHFVCSGLICCLNVVDYDSSVSVSRDETDLL